MRAQELARANQEKKAFFVFFFEAAAALARIEKLLLTWHAFVCACVRHKFKCIVVLESFRLEQLAEKKRASFGAHTKLVAAAAIGFEECRV